MHPRQMIARTETAAARIAKATAGLAERFGVQPAEAPATRRDAGVTAMEAAEAQADALEAILAAVTKAAAAETPAKAEVKSKK